MTNLHDDEIIVKLRAHDQLVHDLKDRIGSGNVSQSLQNELDAIFVHIDASTADFVADLKGEDRPPHPGRVGSTPEPPVTVPNLPAQGNTFDHDNEQIDPNAATLVDAEEAKQQNPPPGLTFDHENDNAGA